MKNILFILITTLSLLSEAQPYRFEKIDGKPFVIRPDGIKTPLLPPPTPLVLEGADKEWTARRILELSVADSARPDVVNLTSNQTGIKDQQDRGTCGIFSTLGAIEAHYKRVHGLTLDLSEQFYFHQLKSNTLTYPRYYKYENQTSFWYGAGTPSLAETNTYLIPLDSFAPYKNMTEMRAIRDSIPGAGLLNWAPTAAENLTTQAEIDTFEYSTRYIPQAARENAIYGAKRTTLLGAAEATNPAVIEGFLAANKEVAVDFVLNWKFNTAKNAWDYDSTVTGDGHAMLIIGYDRRDQTFLIKNSWGGTAFLRVTYEFLRRCAGGGAVVEEVFAPSGARPMHSRWLGKWNMDHDGWKGKLVIRRLNGTASVRTRLGHYYGSDGRPKAVNGYFTNNGQSLVFNITSSDDAPPTDTSGQVFQIYNFSWDPQNSAGITTWSGNQVGAFLSRNPITTPTATTSFNKNKWIGRWKMNHDGWKGTLFVDGIGFGSNPDAVVARYQDSSGAWKPVSGTIAASVPSIARLSINFGTPQNFSLSYHVWDEGRFSGRAEFGGGYVGVTGSKE